MHIPDVERAMAELVRVLKKGGILVISEGNHDSLESGLLLAVKRLLGRQKENVMETSAGMEYWADGPAGKLLSRQMNIDWLLKRFADLGLTVQDRVAGQFTELYSRTSNRLLQRLFHAVNRFWFSYVKSPSLAYGNIILFRKETGVTPAPISQ
jgi:SAM-dependent methyltransferase